MKTIGLSLALALALFHSAHAQGTAKTKKLVEWGWDEPDTEFMRANVAKYRAKVYQRGGEWMKAVNGPYPGILLLLPYIYSITGGAAKDRAGASYGLLGDFVDGMLDACTPQARIVDAWEGAYTYKTKAQFEKAMVSLPPRHH